MHLEQSSSKLGFGDFPHSNSSKFNVGNLRNQVLKECYGITAESGFVFEMKDSTVSINA